MFTSGPPTFVLDLLVDRLTRRIDKTTLSAELVEVCLRAARLNPDPKREGHLCIADIKVSKEVHATTQTSLVLSLSDKYCKHPDLSTVKEIGNGITKAAPFAGAISMPTETDDGFHIQARADLDFMATVHRFSDFFTKEGELDMQRIPMSFRHKALDTYNNLGSVSSRLRSYIKSPQTGAAKQLWNAFCAHGKMAREERSKLDGLDSNIINGKVLALHDLVEDGETEVDDKYDGIVHLLEDPGKKDIVLYITAYGQKAVDEPKAIEQADEHDKAAMAGGLKLYGTLYKALNDCTSSDGGVIDLADVLGTALKPDLNKDNKKSRICVTSYSAQVYCDSSIEHKQQ